MAEIIEQKYQILPLLLPEEFDSLKASIAERGVEVPIIVDQDDQTIDGFHRWSACDELGVFCPREVRHFQNEAEKFELALRLNCRRRQLNRQQKRDLIAAYLVSDPQIADNHLANLIGGVSQNTVADVRAELETTFQIEKLDRHRGMDGKDRPTKYKKVVANTAKEAEAAFKAIGNLPQNCDGKIIDCTTAKRKSKDLLSDQERNLRLARAVEAPKNDDDIQIYHCPFQDLEKIAGIEPDSVNLICTDIPYVGEFLNQINDLAALAERILVPGGTFVTLSGQYYLPQVIADLGKHLTYRWQMASVWNGDGCVIYPLNLISQWKPILVFSKGKWDQKGRWPDVLRVLSKEKDWHEWQQPLEEVSKLIDYFSKPGDLVVDPCGGGFTTAIACHRSNRRFVGCDIDHAAVVDGQDRLAHERQIEPVLIDTIIVEAEPDEIPDLAKAIQATEIPLDWRPVNQRS